MMSETKDPRCNPRASLREFYWFWLAEWALSDPKRRSVIFSHAPSFEWVQGGQNVAGKRIVRVLLMLLCVISIRANCSLPRLSCRCGYRLLVCVGKGVYFDCAADIMSISIVLQDFEYQEVICIPPRKPC